MNWEIALFLLPGLIVGITFHEAAHAITASWLGDKNAKRMGRVTLNPFKHLSPLGKLKKMQRQKILTDFETPLESLFEFLQALF